MAVNKQHEVPTSSVTDDSSTTVANLVEMDTSASGFQLVNPYRTNKVDSLDLVELATEIQKVRFLQEQARKVLQEAKENADLHHIPCNFVKKPGNIYHIYRRQSGQKYFSIINPKEWGSTCPHEYLGSYRLEHDHSWTPENKMEARSNDQKMIDKLLSCSNTLSITMGK
ncbi:uncharacterized protein C1orf50 homolog isoform X4 [Procambarus clarkii]|uniref:uncharacterized protein C1orf50 homolog isoform X4 n=1 Tax=Procambarus clarkii TaxID=6728 RepID=UPI003742FDDA